MSKCEIYLKRPKTSTASCKNFIIYFDHILKPNAKEGTLVPLKDPFANNDIVKQILIILNNWIGVRSKCDTFIVASAPQGMDEGYIPPNSVASYIALIMLTERIVKRQWPADHSKCIELSEIPGKEYLEYSIFSSPFLPQIPLIPTFVDRCNQDYRIYKRTLWADNTYQLQTNNIVPSKIYNRTLEQQIKPVPTPSELVDVISTLISDYTNLEHSAWTEKEKSWLEIKDKLLDNLQEKDILIDRERAFFSQEILLKEQEKQESDDSWRDLYSKLSKEHLISTENYTKLVVESKKMKKKYQDQIQEILKSNTDIEKLARKVLHTRRTKQYKNDNSKDSETLCWDSGSVIGKRPLIRLALSDSDEEELPDFKKCNSNGITESK